MRNLVLVVALGLGGCIAGDEVGESAQAIDEANGIYQNGIYQNGIYQNGIYQNGIYQNGIYQNGTFENGYGIDESAAWQKPWARVFVGPGGNGFSIAYTDGWGWAMNTTSWAPASFTNFVRYVDGSATTCAHPVTQTGSALSATCDVLAREVCLGDGYCCATSWDGTCLAEAVNLAAAAPAGFHSVAVTGGGLLDSHSGCAALVDAQRSSCRTNWDDTCVDTAYAVCFVRYVTRPRVEQGRLMADACVEPRVDGASACPVPGSGASGAECCRRSLVLNGVYRDHQPEEPGFYGEGHKIEWSNWTQMTTVTGRSTHVTATLVPDPCTGPWVYSKGLVYRDCAPTHHLWQLAGPGAAFYPDCLNVASTATSTCALTDGAHQGVSLRAVLVNVLTALTNTSGHYTVDVRYTRLDPLKHQFLDTSDPGLLPPDTSYNLMSTEAVWDSYVSNNDTLSPQRRAIIGYPLCRGGSMQRLDPSVSGVGLCTDYWNYGNPLYGSGSATTIRTLWQ